MGTEKEGWGVIFVYCFIDFDTYELKEYKSQQN